MAVPENYAEICKERSVECRKSLLATLEGMKIQRVTADYSGSRDEGAIESVEFYADAEMQTQVPVDDELADTVEAIFYDVLESRFEDWEDGEGADGSFVWTVDGDKLDHEHKENYIAQNTTNKDGWPGEKRNKRLKG